MKKQYCYTRALDNSQTGMKQNYDTFTDHSCFTVKIYIISTLIKYIRFMYKLESYKKNELNNEEIKIMILT